MEQARGKLPFPAIAAVIICLGIGVYGSSLKNEFIYDDVSHVVKNAAVRSFSYIPGIFRHTLTYYTFNKEDNFFRPLETVSFMADYFLWGMTPFGFRLTNVLLHITVAILLFRLLFAITGRQGLALAVSLIYLVHPVNTEAVTYISGRADPLAFIFLLIAMICTYRYQYAKIALKPVYYAGVFVSVCAGLISKELAVAFPLFLAFFDYCYSEKTGYAVWNNRKLLFYAPLLAVVIIFLFYKHSIVAVNTMLINPSPLGVRAYMAAGAVADYIRLSFFPFGLHMEYVWLASQSMFGPKYLFSCALVAVIFYLLYKLHEKGREDGVYKSMFFGLGWFLLALFPFLNIVFVLNAPFAEHWLYIPGPGLILAVCAAVAYVTRAARHRYINAFLVLFAVAFLAVLALRQNAVWKDNLTFCLYTLKHSPRSSHIYNNLAPEYYKRGDIAQAKAMFEKALELDPTNYIAAGNLKKFGSKTADFDVNNLDK